MLREDAPEDWTKILAQIVRQEATIPLGRLPSQFHRLVSAQGSDPVFAESPFGPGHKARSWRPLAGLAV